MTLSYRHTRIACYMGYITQAIINNLSPLLFLTYQQEFSLSLSQISLMITVNFTVQIAVDLLSTKFVDRIGYRASMVLAQILSVAGLIGLGMLPALLAPYTALILSTVLCALGGGLLEVLVSPILEALPSEHKASEMSLLHSFYCWGHVGVVLLSTAYFLLIGRSRWQALPLLWALIPLATGVLFARVPLCKLTQDGQSMPVRRLAVTPVFWVFMLLMVCAGASEQAMSQWASLFAEKGLNVSKTLGDLLGPCAFATLMGLSRMLFGRAQRLSTHKALTISALGCVASYLITIFSPWPILSLAGCALCGFSVGVMWPGVFSTASAALPAGGTAMFALLALAGDVGCCVGPGLVGAISDSVTVQGKSLLSAIFPDAELSQLALKMGFFLAIIFPLLLLLGMALLKKQAKSLSESSD